MDNIFTPTSNISENDIRASLHGEKSFSPKECTLELIKSFARNFRAVNGVDANIQGFILN